MIILYRADDKKELTEYLEKIPNPDIVFPEDKFGNGRALAEFMENLMDHNDNLVVVSQSDIVQNLLHIFSKEKRKGCMIRYWDGKSLYNIRIDELGNVLDAPSHFRRWEMIFNNRFLGL